MTSARLPIGRRPRVVGLLVGILLAGLPGVGWVPSAAAADVGVRDFSFGTSASAPTAEKPQSKLWFNDGSWWGILWSKQKGIYDIWKFNWATDTWTDTGTGIDSRNRSRADALWDGSRLYVVSHVKEGTSGGDQGIKVLKYSYAPATKTYSLDAGFPVVVATGAVEAAVLDKDSTGMLWVTYTLDNPGSGRSVYVTHSTTTDKTWITPYVLPVTGANNMSSDDISALVAYNGKIGVMWSNQSADTMYFASHTDGASDTTWSLNPALQGPKYADDHINLKSLQADASGQVFAAVKTSLNDTQPPTSSEPLILLLILDGAGSWQRRTFGRVSDNHTRPMVLIDNENRQLYMFAVAPCCSGGTIYYKKTSLDNPNFDQGIGIPFIQLSTDTIMTNPTSTKQALNRTTGLLVEAADDHSRFYAHNKLNLTGPDTTPPDTTIDAGPTGMVGSASATFAFSSSETGSTFGCTLDGGPISGCTSPKTYTGLADGSHTFTVRATDAAGNTDPSPASRTWTVDLQGGTILFSDGFESGNFAAWTSATQGGDGTATVQSTTVKTGTFAARIFESANTGSFAYARKTLSADRVDVTAAGDFRVQTEGASGDNVSFIRLLDASANRLVSVYRLNGSTNKIGLTYGGVHFITTGVLPLNTWGQVSLRLVVNGTGASTVEVKLNGTLVYRTTTASFTLPTRRIQIGNDTAKQAGTVFVDNIVVTDSATPAPPPSTTVPAFDHIFVVVEENKRFDQIIGNSAAPYLNQLASQYGLATNYRTITHPSLPNYLAMAGGSTFGITSDCNPTGAGACPVNASSVADLVEAAGKTWRGYFDAMPLPCQTTTVGTYVVRHNPFVYFDGIRNDNQRCVDSVVPFSRLASDLQSASTTPALSFIVPDSCNDMHDCPISTGDAWLQTNLAPIFASPAWTSQNSLLVITWDEDDEISGSNGTFPTILVGSSVTPGITSASPRNHYSLLATIERGLGLGTLTANDAGASPLAEFFRP